MRGKIQFTKWLLILTVSVVFGTTLLASADPQTKAQLKAKMSPYITNASSLAASNQPAISGAIQGFAQGPDPIWYGGNNLAASAMVQDFWVNLTHNFPAGFVDCLDFKVHSNLCKNSWGIPTGVKISYRIPIQQILTRRFFQNRYMLPAYYTALKASGFYENVWYDLAKRIDAPMALTNASIQSAIKLNSKSWIPYIPAYGPILPQIASNQASIQLDQPNDRGRYDGGVSGNSNLDQLEYYLGPNLVHVVWDVVANYFPFLKKLPCLPPHQAPAPFGSEDPGMIELTRNPILGFLFYKDKDLRKDLQEWYKNPAVCQEWMMSKQRKNIPYDMYNTTAGIFTVNHWLPAPLTPIPNSNLSKFDRMCTNNWGGSIPFTTMHQVHDSPFIDAGKNLLKATRLGYGLWKTYLQGNQGGNYVRYYPFNKQDDAYQLTYKDEWDCKSVGTPAKPFQGADALNEPGEYGLYSMTHWWRRPKCCMSFGAAYSMQAFLAAMSP